MPRKKSAAKKAKEVETPQELPIGESLFEDHEDVAEDGFTINEEYARRFEHNKKREDLHRLQEKYKDADLEDDSDASTSEEEDDIGDLNTPQIDAAILKMMSRIRNKDPELYTTEAKFFEEAEKEARDASAKGKQQKPTTIADVHRQTLLSGKANDDQDEEDEEDLVRGQQNGPTHVQEQDDLRNAFRGLGEEADSDDDVLVPRKRTTEETQLEDDQYQAFLKEQIGNGVEGDLLKQLTSGNQDNPEGEEFLMKYVLNRGWIDKNADKVPSYDQIVDSDEEFADWEEKAEKFETTYNFRFEQPGATEITTHPRDIQSVRRKDEKRKKERETKMVKENSRKQERMEELNRLKNLKKAELEEKIRKIEEVTGRRMDFDEVDLEGDFDPDNWDRKMIDRFNDAYYEETESKPTWTDDIDIDDLPIAADDDDADDGAEGETGPVRSGTGKLTKREEKSRKRKIEALVDASVPDPLGPGGRMFRYRQTDPETFGLSVEDILFADDTKLNEYVGLKKLAAFKPREKVDHDRKKYGAKKRAKQFQKDLWSQSKWARREAVLDAAAEEQREEGGRKTKRKKDKK
ncbi:Kri1 [Taphrina deformans PYCC 5710]|uniref:Kri1 n=1 Tax=Taphrina deformans (strain PYCC 5710 / ATCC 11124 / CBS 356.35 / IMI 108563 / JCM 9778 / NBRC 8474) TaxID=1097556 RepID=R4XFG4_TAPDE|nr:Kri1 [Taphrina deformans PYCC 5710]|eukprot:CCG83206.1 Kri1 [Taphrina deformans PYCC 5710]